MHAYITYPETNRRFAGRMVAARVRVYHAFNVGVDIDGGGRKGSRETTRFKTQKQQCIYA